MLSMKKIPVAVMMAILLTSTPLMAKYNFFGIGDSALYETLKKKGILTDEDIKEIEVKKKEAAKIHSLNVGTRLQLRYEYSDGDKESQRTNDINIRRMRVELTGNMWRDVAYKFEISMDRVQDLHMKDASVTFKHLGPFANIRVGQFKTPFSRQRITSSSKLSVIDRSIIEKLYPGRDTGIELSGKNILGMIDYAVALEKGWGDRGKFSDVDNNEFWYDGRLAFHPLGKVAHHESDIGHSEKPIFEVAINALYAPNQVAVGERSISDMFLADKAFGTSKDVNELTSTELKGLYGDIYTWGPDLTFFYKGFSFMGEYYTAKYNPTNRDTYKSLKSVGYFLQAGYFFIPKTVEVVGRFDRLNRDTSQKTKDDMETYYAGVNYYVSKDHRFKLQAGYLWRKELAGKYEKNDSVILNAQMKF